MRGNPTVGDGFWGGVAVGGPGMVGLGGMTVFVGGTVGDGARVAVPVGLLVAGMTVGTLFTLFVVPVFYSLIAAEHRPETEEETEGLVLQPALTQEVAHA